MSFDALRKDSRAKRKTRDKLDSELLDIRETLRTLGARKKHLERLGLEKSIEYKRITDQEKTRKKTLLRVQDRLKDKKLETKERQAELLKPDPQILVENLELDVAIPFLLMPIRLETRFKEIQHESGKPTKELWVRIYPDDIHVDTHEEILTEGEVAAAQAYWKEVWRAGGDKDQELGAWRVLIRRYGSPRAAWIVRTYKPNNELDDSGNGNRPSVPLPDNEELNPAPTFDTYNAKQESWSRAPRAMCLPDRFVAVGFNNENKIFEYVGNPVPDPLIVGPNPSHTPDDDEGFKVDAEELVVDAEMKWMVDFEEAVRVGMGLKIPLNEQISNGFDRLIVLGLRLSADKDESQGLLEDLIETHHYSIDGFSLIPQGTATNNTRSGGAGYGTFELGDDESFDVEQDKPLFDIETDWNKKRDGQHLCEALGINKEVLEHIQFSDGFDQRDACAMNIALWPATLGYFLEEMMHPLFGSDSMNTIGKIRDFFQTFVKARGSVPAIRIGNQPYGILPIFSFNNWSYPNGKASTGSKKADRRFEKGLYTFLMQMDKEWDEMVKKVTHAGTNGDSQQNLLDILGLHSGSAEFHNRFAVSLEQLSNTLRLTQPKPSPSWIAKFIAAKLPGVFQGRKSKVTDLSKSENFFKIDTAADIIAGFLSELWKNVKKGFDPKISDYPEIFKKFFYNYQIALNGPLVDVPPLSETDPVQPFNEDGENYIEWLATSPFDTIRRQDFEKRDGEKVSAPNSLLYLMLRHSVMNAYFDAAWNFFDTAKLPNLPRVEPSFLYIKDQQPGQSKLSLLYRQADEELRQSHPDVFTDDNTVAEHISKPDVIKNRPETKNLKDVREALGCLQERPTAALARVFCEHVDLCSYRLDAWKLGLVNQRLSELRGSGSNANKGIYLGAFGWLENLKPKQPLRPFTGKVPEEFTKPSDPVLQEAQDNGGYIHAPSLNHAVTAAVLRNSYITHADKDKPSVTAVNLTSERVRNALSIIEGIQNGQGLNALLGYQFERGLHDRYKEAEVDRFIFPLRKKFPLVADHLNKSRRKDPIEAVEARNVIDGLALLRHVQDTGRKRYPFGKLGLPLANRRQRQAINSEIARLENTMDSVADLLTAESTYQVVRGNYDRAGAVVDALSKGENLPTPEILQTPRSGYSMTHRLCIQFETDITIDQMNPYSGADPDNPLVPLTPRAKAEPGLNKWLAGVIGNDPESVACNAVYVEEGADPENGDFEHVKMVTLKDLELQPIDLLYILNNNLNQEESELDSRIIYSLKKKENLPHGAKILIKYTESIDSKTTFFELMPLMKSLRTLILDSRPLNAEDMILPSDTSKDLSQDAAPDPNPKGWDVEELHSRVSAIHDALDDLRDVLGEKKDALDSALTSDHFIAIRKHLMETASFGIQQSIPLSAIEETNDSAQELISQTERVITLIRERLKAYDEATSVPTDIPIEEQISAWIEAGKILLGSSFVWMPGFNLKLPEEIQKSFNDREHMLRYIKEKCEFPMEEWLFGIARVRPKVQCLEQTILMTDIFATNVPELTFLQLPYKSGDFWLGMDYPEDYDFDGDRLLITTVYTTPLEKDCFQKLQTGLLFDEWVEFIPTKRETTGLTFHYDAPNSEPPQTLLLAVAPEKTGHWEWRDLVATVNEALDMSKKRAVEPQHIDESKLSQFLPAIMIPITQYLITVATNLLVNVGMSGVKINIPNR